jgi:hypothetical protein
MEILYRAGAQIIKHGYELSPLQKGFNHMRADKSSSTRNQSIHDNLRSIPFMRARKSTPKPREKLLLVLW